MSLNELILDIKKPWLNIRVNDLCVDGVFCNKIPVSSLESTGVVGFLHDNATDIVARPIEITDLQDIGFGAPDGTVLTHNAGTVSFVAPGADESIYSTDGTLGGNRTVDCNSNYLHIDNNENFRVNEKADGVCSLTIDQSDIFGTGNPGLDLSYKVPAEEEGFEVNAASRATVYYRNTAGTESHELQVDSNGVGIAAEKLGINPSVVSVSVNYPGTVGDGAAIINSDNVVLSKEPPENSSATRFLCRNNATNEMEVKDESDITVADSQINGGSNREIMISNGTNGGWGTLGRALYKQSVTQTLGVGSTGILFGSEEFNNTTITNTTVGVRSRFGLPAGNWYVNAICNVLNTSVSSDGVIMNIRAAGVIDISSSSADLDVGFAANISGQAYIVGPVNIEVYISGVATSADVSNSSIYFMEL